MTDDHPAADAPTLDELRLEVASATGAARAGVDVARHGTSHLARQITYALAHGAAETPDTRALLRTLATESERLSGGATLILGRLSEAERLSKDAAERDELVDAVRRFNAIHADGLALRVEADAVRRRLPRAYGDPLNLDTSWPAS